MGGNILCFVQFRVTSITMWCSFWLCLVTVLCVIQTALSVNVILVMIKMVFYF